MQIPVEVWTAVSAGGVLLAALGSWRSASVTRSAAQGGPLSAMLAEYSSPSMAQSLRILRNWREEHGERFTQAYGKELAARSDLFHDVDAARRQVSHYFQKILALHQAGCLSKGIRKQLLMLHGIDLLFQVVEPLEHELNAGYMKKNFDELRRLSGRKETEPLIRDVPAKPPAREP